MITDMQFNRSILTLCFHQVDYDGKRIANETATWLAAPGLGHIKCSV